MNEAMALAALPLFAAEVETADDLDTVEHIIWAVLNGLGVVWGLPTSAIFAQRLKHAETGTLVMRLGPAVGDLREILELEPDICAWARGEGCGSIQIEASRAGWARVLSPLGYRLQDGTLYKTLAVH